MEYIKLPVSQRLNIQAFSNMLDLKYIQNSYKLYWFYAIFEEIKMGKEKIPFRELIFRMIAKSWYSLIEYKLHFGAIDQLNRVVIYLYNNYRFEKDILEEELIGKLNEINDENLNYFIKEFSKYVPYRLLSPFYPELIGIKDQYKNNMILELSNKGDMAIYKINNLEKSIEINEKWSNYIFENQAIMEGWILNKLIFFLQTKNPNVPAIPFKIYPPQKRKLTNATKYWKKVIEINKINDIYTDKILGLEDTISIDHFVPWSFVLHDELWNLVPTTREVNSSKNDKLPQLDRYLDKYCNIQYIGLKTALNYNFGKKEIEDYFTISKIMNLNKDIPKEFFVENLKNTIMPIYQIAYNQGFMIWGK